MNVRRAQLVLRGGSRMRGLTCARGLYPRGPRSNHAMWSRPEQPPPRVKWNNRLTFVADNGTQALMRYTYLLLISKSQVYTSFTSEVLRRLSSTSRAAVISLYMVLLPARSVKNVPVSVFTVLESRTTALRCLVVISSSIELGRVWGRRS